MTSLIDSNSCSTEPAGTANKSPIGDSNGVSNPPSNDPLIETSNGGHDFLIGAVFRETRSEVIEQIHAKIRKLRKRESTPYSLPTRIHWRVLKVTPEEITIISVEDPTANTHTLSRRDIAGLLATRSLLATDFEPLAILRLPENGLTDNQIQCRDRNYQLIKPLIELGDDMFNESKRWQIIKTICGEQDVAPMKVYRIFRRYLQGGRNKNALAGRWFRRSLNIGRGSRIIGKVEVQAGAKAIRVGRPRLDGCRPFFVTQADVQKIVRGAARYYHKPEGGNWHRAWLLTLGDFYIEVDPHSKLSLDEQLKEYTPDCYPSEAEFRYWAKTDKMIVARAKKRLGERKFNLTARPLNGKTEDKATGPGSHFQIDPTPLDIISVHQVSRRPIGKLILYLVVDAFSHLIVGYYLHVGNPGYDPAALALLAAAEDKVALCRRFGIEISPHEWPAACLPGRLIADSELSSLKAHSLVTNGVLNLQIVPSFRADLKGLVEAMLGATRAFTQHMPGYSIGARKRAEVPPEASAALDFLENNCVVINWIRQRNRRIMTDYNLTDAMVADGLVPTPINLWHWGVANCGGLRRKWDQDLLKRLCLPTGKGYITRRGLEFSGLVYEPLNSDQIDLEAWQVQAAEKSWAETVSYHPDAVNELWLHHDSRLIRMQLAEVSRGKKTWSFSDLEGFAAEQAEARAVESSKTIPVVAVLESEQQRIMEEAKRKTEEARGTVAERRKEKVDKPTERESQRNLISGRPTSPNPTTDLIIPRKMKDEDEQQILAELRATRTPVNQTP